jgi:voltage-gated potassium channel
VKKSNLQKEFYTPWWVAMQITNIGSGYRPVTVGGHVLCLGISIFALAIFGYLTAVFAAFFIGRDAEDPKSEIPNQTSIYQLSVEVALLRRSIDDVLRACLKSKSFSQTA